MWAERYSMKSKSMVDDVVDTHTFNTMIIAMPRTARLGYPLPKIATFVFSYHADLTIPGPAVGSGECRPSERGARGKQQAEATPIMSHGTG